MKEDGSIAFGKNSFIHNISNLVSPNKEALDDEAIDIPALDKDKEKNHDDHENINFNISDKIHADHEDDKHALTKDELYKFICQSLESDEAFNNTITMFVENHQFNDCFLVSNSISNIDYDSIVSTLEKRLHHKEYYSNKELVFYLNHYSDIFEITLKCLINFDFMEKLLEKRKSSSHIEDKADKKDKCVIL